MNKLVDIRTSIKHAKNVVIIDDQDVCCTINAAIIKSIDRNITINMFTKTTDALIYIETHKVDLVITDYLMDKMTGLDFIDRVKSLPESDFISFIIITVCSDKLVHRAFRNKGASDIFTKPPELSRLKESCIELLYRPLNQLA